MVELCEHDAYLQRMEANVSLRSMGSNVRLDDRDKEIYWFWVVCEFMSCKGKRLDA